jgi:hypothetical protein
MEIDQRHKKTGLRDQWKFFVRKFRDPSLDERPARDRTFNHYWESKEAVAARSHLAAGLPTPTVATSPIFTDVAQQAHYFITEMAALRVEILDIKKREMQTEALALALLGAVFYVIFVLRSLEAIPGAEIAAGVIPIITTGLGYMRFKEDQRNIFEIDCYLMEIERLFHSEGGWVSYFFINRDMKRYFYSRALIWGLMNTVSLLGGIFAIALGVYHIAT